MESLLDIQTSIQNTSYDIKAEVLIAGLYQKGVSKDQILIRNEGVFKRSYRKDITACLISELKSFDEVIEIILSRDGIYDILPEGLFHQSIKGSNQSVQKMVEEHRKFKREEEEARKFFLPFENEFFFQKVHVEDLEKKFYYDIHSEKNEILNKFWKLEKGLPLESAKRLLEFMPQSGKICGNLNLMQQTLSKILDEPVEVCLHNTLQHFESSNRQSSEESLLGVDYMMGNSYQECLPVFEFKLGPFENLSIDSFLHQKPNNLLLKKYYDCFTPLEAEIKTTFVTNKNKTVKDNSVILGYNFDL